MTASSCRTTSSASGVKVIGGVEDYKTAPAVVGLLLLDAAFNGEHCTGSIVRDDLILTAAHCVATLKIKFISVADQLSQDLYSKGTKSTQNYVVFPGYSPTGV